MKSQNCLNCEKELVDNFCSGCGQKADTHRISFANFISHDVLHGTFHLEKGILYTAKNALIRPGQAALEYIAGKRKRFYNVFYLILITVGSILFLRHFYHTLNITYGEIVPEKPFLNEASRRISEFITSNSKFVIFLFVPFGAVTGFILFNRRRLNLSEHTIIAGMILLGMLLISAIGHLLFFLNLIPGIILVADIINALSPILVIAHIGYGYYNAFVNDYTKFEIIYRIAMLYAILVLLLVTLTIILIGIFSDWKMGQFDIRPFG